MIKRILGIVLAVTMGLTVLSASVAAATSVYVDKPVYLVEEDFDKADGSHAFSLYPTKEEMIDGATEADGNAMMIPGTATKSGFKAVPIDLGDKYITEFDFVHQIENATSSSYFSVMFVDRNSTATVTSFGLRVGVLPFKVGEWYSMKIEVDATKLTATGNTPAGAVKVLWKEKGAANWIVASQDSDNTFDSSEILFYRSHSSFGTTIFGNNAVGFGHGIAIDNFSIYYYEKVLDSVCEGYGLTENFEGNTHKFSAGKVENGAVSHTATITASVDVPDYAVIEFDAYRNGTSEFDVYIKYNNSDAVPHFGLRIMADSYYANKWYSYKIIVKKDKLVNDNGNMNSSAIFPYRKAEDETVWKAAPMSVGYNSVTSLHNVTREPVGTVGEPMVRFHTGIGSANLPENAIGFSRGTILDNIRVSGGGAISISDFVNNDTKIGATVEFTDTDAVELSGTRSIFFALEKGGRIVGVDFAKPTVQNGVWTASVEADKTDYDSARLFVWGENNVPAMADWNVTTVFDAE